MEELGKDDMPAELLDLQLRERQRRFAYEIIKDWNRTQAAIRAGYAPASAAHAGSDNLRKPHIITAIKQNLAAVEKCAEITPERIVMGFGAIAFAPAGAASNKDRLSAYANLAKIHHLLDDHTTHDHKGKIDLGLDLKNLSYEQLEQLRAIVAASAGAGADRSGDVPQAVPALPDALPNS